MNLIALNGSGYSIARWLPGIPCPDELHWTYAKALELAEEIKQPTTLIGFSRGATMAIVAALHCKHVQKVYCHSPSFRIRVQKRKFDMEVFCTTGDRTPTEWGAKMTAREFGAKLKEFEPVLFEPKTKVERFMLKANHQFHNCLPYLQERLAADLAGELDHE